MTAKMTNTKKRTDAKNEAKMEKKNHKDEKSARLNSKNTTSTIFFGAKEKDEEEIFWIYRLLPRSVNTNMTLQCSGL